MGTLVLLISDNYKLTKREDGKYVVKSREGYSVAYQHEKEAVMFIYREEQAKGCFISMRTKPWQKNTQRNNSEKLSSGIENKKE